MWIPADRFLAVLDREPQRLRYIHEAGARRVRALRHNQSFISLSAADRILTKLDLLHYWHIPKDEGGLADIYEDGMQYGEPENAVVVFRASNRIYATEEERQAARRRTYRESYLRRKARGVA